MEKKVDFDMIYLYMKKIFLTLFFLSILFIPKVVDGQDIFSANIPGVTCGVANDTTGKDLCCNLPKIVDCDGPLVKFASDSANVISFLKTIVPALGFVSDKLSEGLDNCKIVDNYLSQEGNNSSCISGEPKTVSVNHGRGGTTTACKCTDTTSANPNTAMTEMCAQYLTLSSASLNELKSCLSCANTNGMWTGMGCLPLDLNTLITSFVLTTGIGIGGSFALLCIIYAAFMMQSSEGNPEKLKKAQEMITSCIMGLMLIIFSVFIMKLIGVNILRIPGFK